MSSVEPTDEPVRVLVQRLDAGVPLPGYARPGDAGADIVIAQDVTLAPGERAVVPTGLAIALPDGYAAFVHPRSGLAARAGLALVNAPGTVDSGYRGEIKVIVINHDPASTLHLSRGERIAQLVFQRVGPGGLRRGDGAAPVGPRRGRPRFDGRGRGSVRTVSTVKGTDQ